MCLPIYLMVWMVLSIVINTVDGAAPLAGGSLITLVIYILIIYLEKEHAKKL